MDPKSRLKIFCDKNKMPSPVYMSVNNGSSHKPLWTATLCFNGYECEGEERHKKTESEMLAAEKMLKLLSERKVKIDRVVKEKTIYVFDVENCGKEPQSALTENEIWIGFITKDHHLVPKYSTWTKITSNVREYEFGKSYLCLVKHQGQKDVSDHWISGFMPVLADFLGKVNEKVNIYIVSKDHAAWCSKSCLEYWLETYPNLQFKVDVIPKML